METNYVIKERYRVNDIIVIC